MNEYSFFQQLNLWHHVISCKMDTFPVKDLGKDSLSVLISLPVMSIHLCLLQNHLYPLNITLILSQIHLLVRHC